MVAAGKASYDAVRAQGEVDPGQWRWDEAEALLVVGFEMTEEDQAHGPPADHGEPGVTSRSHAAMAFDPVTSWRTHSARPQHRLDHRPRRFRPDDGRTPVHDPDWVEAQRHLAADQSFLARRLRVEHLGLWLTVRPVPPDGEPAPEPSSHSPFDGFRPVRGAIASQVETSEGPGVVLVVPVSDFSDPAHACRAISSAVDQLLTAAGA